MALNMEKILMDARLLVTRLKEHDGTADTLLTQTQTLHQRMEAMKQYEDDLTELNEIARHRPRSSLVLGIAQENRQIRDLQQENRELRLSLEEHQSALELIMSKYREQILKLIASNKLEKKVVQQDHSEEISSLLDKVCEMAAVMQKAVSVDEKIASSESEQLNQLKQENQGLRELLAISNSMNGPKSVNRENSEVADSTEAKSTEDISNSLNESTETIRSKSPTPQS